MQRAEAESERALVAIVRAAAPKTWTAAAWLLERRFPARWARPEIRRQPPPPPKTAEDLSKLPEEELLKRWKALTGLDWVDPPRLLPEVEIPIPNGQAYEEQ